MKSPVASVIIPVYNTGSYIADCLDSITRQSFADFEIQIIDDGSTDNTVEIVRDYIRKDPRIVLTQVKNGGVSRARNIGLERARGKYILFVDSDDIVSPDYIEVLVSTMEQTGCDCSACGIATFADGKTPRFTSGSKIRFDGLESHLCMFGKPKGFLCNKGFRASLIERVHLRLDEQILQSEDMLFLLDYLALCDSVVYDEGIKYCYRQRFDSATNDMGNLHWFDLLEVFRAYRGRFSFDANSRSIIADSFIFIAYEGLYRATICRVDESISSGMTDMTHWCEANASPASLAVLIKRLAYKHAMRLIIARRKLRLS